MYVITPQSTAPPQSLNVIYQFTKEYDRWLQLSGQCKQSLDQSLPITNLTEYKGAVLHKLTSQTSYCMQKRVWRHWY